MTDDRNRPERPRAEPEIIPPERGGYRSDWRQAPWRGTIFSETQGARRVHVFRLGPFGMALLILAAAAIVALLLIAVLGAILIWIPVVAVVVIIAALFRPFRR
jgi:hypothetical protein